MSQTRIEAKTAYYNRFEWLADRRRNLGYLKNISAFPKVYCKLVDEFDANDELVKAVRTKAGTRPGTVHVGTAHARHEDTTKTKSTKEAGQKESKEVSAQAE